jgi:hypothetical protein
MAKKYKDLVGKKYGSLIVHGRVAGVITSNRWLCQCKCKSQTIIDGADLESGTMIRCAKCEGKEITKASEKIIATIEQKEIKEFVLLCCNKARLIVTQSDIFEIPTSTVYSKDIILASIILEKIYSDIVKLIDFLEALFPSFADTIESDEDYEEFSSNLDKIEKCIRNIKKGDL